MCFDGLHGTEGHTVCCTEDTINGTFLCEDAFHGFGNAWGEVRHTASEVGYSSNSVEGFDGVEGGVVVGSVYLLLVGNTNLASDYIKVDIYRTVLHAAVAHETAVGNRFYLASEIMVSNVLQQVDSLNLAVAEFFVHRTCVDADATTGTGAEFEHRISGLAADAVANAKLSEIYKEYLREDVHVSAEGHQGEEGAEGDAVKQPAGVFKIDIIKP